MSSGLISPGCTISSTSTIAIFAALAQSGLKFLEVALKIQLPLVSAFHALIKA
jgi:isopropylmalate/homocitrate/citramalate synthase